MFEIFIALAPIFSLIFLGYFLKKKSFPSSDFWSQADKLTYFILMPSLLIYKLSSAKLDNLENLNYILVATISIFIILFLVVLINKIYKVSNQSFTSIAQGAIRFNTYVFLALSSAIYGDTGLILAALLLTFIIPLVNIICIGVFAFYISEDRVSILGILKSLFSNPIVIACIIGGVSNFLAINYPLAVVDTLKILSSAALPLGLLSVGFTLSLKELSTNKVALFDSSLLKLIITPFVFYFVASFFGISGVVLGVLLIFAALPTAPTALVFARHLGGDVRLMSSIITFQTLISIFVITFVVYTLS